MSEIAKATIARNYARLCTQVSDINEHLPTLRAYAERVNSIVEMGVRNVVSTWALLAGLTAHSKPGESTNNSLIGVDIERCAYDVPIAMARTLGVEASFVLANSIEADIPERDLLFIDTWHVYGHLKRELAKHADRTRKFILMHDTTVDGERGESLRIGSDIAAQMRVSGYPRAKIERGLWPAIEEFLEANTKNVTRITTV